MPGIQQLRHQQKRKEKLNDIDEQVAEGKLVIRKMTAEERKRYPARPPRRAGAKRRR